MPDQKVLIPYNFTNYDQRALEFVIRAFAHRADVEISLFNAYTPIPDIPMKNSPVMEKMKANLAFLSQKIQEQKDNLEIARQKLLESGFEADKVLSVFIPVKKDIAGEIVEVAKKGNYDVIVINYKSDRVTRFFKGSVFNKVVTALSGKIVCTVT